MPTEFNPPHLFEDRKNRMYLFWAVLSVVVFAGVVVLAIFAPIALLVLGCIAVFGLFFVYAPVVVQTTARWFDRGVWEWAEVFDEWWGQW